jgi:hypothetical protein
LEERDDGRSNGLTLTVLMVIVTLVTLAFAIVVGLTLRHHSAAALKHPASALQQTDPISSR